MTVFSQIYSLALLRSAFQGQLARYSRCLDFHGIQTLYNESDIFKVLVLKGLVDHKIAQLQFLQLFPVCAQIS